MSIFVNNTPSQTPEPNIENLQRQLSLNTANTAKRDFADLCRKQRSGIENIWNNPKLTPVQAVEALGTNAAKFFAGHGILTGAILQIAALDGVQSPDILLPTNAFTINPDGSVTVLDTPYAG